MSERVRARGFVGNRGLHRKPEGEGVTAPGALCSHAALLRA